MFPLHYNSDYKGRKQEQPLDILLGHVSGGLSAGLKLQPRSPVVKSVKASDFVVRLNLGALLRFKWTIAHNSNAACARVH